MRNPGTRTYTAVIMVAIYLLVTAAGWPLGSRCGGVLGCAEPTERAYDSGDPCEQAPSHAPCSSSPSGCCESIPCSCHCLCGSLAGLRYYLPELSTKAVSAKLQGSVDAPALPATVLPVRVAHSYLIPPEPTAFTDSLLYLSTVVLLC